MNDHPTISIIIPSAPDRSFAEILDNLKQIKPLHTTFEIFIIKGTYPPLQRNLGIQKATGKYIFLFDDDIIIPKGSIEKVLTLFTEHPELKVIGGPNITPKEDSFLQHCFGYAHASYFVGLNTAVRYYPAKNLKQVNENHLISCNLAFDAKTLKEHPFDPQIFPNEENDVLGRILRDGNTLSYAPEFMVYHHRRNTLKKYIKQIFYWGVGRTLHTLYRKHHFKITFFVPLAFLLYLLSLIFFHPLWYFMALVLYIFLDIVFSFLAVFQSKNVFTFFIMPWLFPLTHITYACGLFWGFPKKFQKQKTLPDTKDFEFLEIKIGETKN